MNLRPDDAPFLARHLDRLMRRINARLHPRAAAMDTDNVGPLGGMVVMALAERGPLSIAALTSDMGRDKSQMTRLIQMLETKGLVSRAADPDDKRVSVVSLTDKGRDFEAGVERVLTDAIADVLAPLDGDERAVLAKLIAKI